MADWIEAGYYAWKAVKGGAPHALRIEGSAESERGRIAFLNGERIAIDDEKMLFARRIEIVEYDRLLERARRAKQGTPEADPYIAADPANDEAPF